MRTGALPLLGWGLGLAAVAVLGAAGFGLDLLPTLLLGGAGAATVALAGAVAVTRRPRVAAGTGELSLATTALAVGACAIVVGAGAAGAGFAAPGVLLVVLGAGGLVAERRGRR